MSIALLIAVIIVACFAAVLLFGAPYLPTQKEQVNLALGLFGDTKDKTIYELGAGSGGMVKALAKDGAKVIGYELNPLLFVLLALRFRKNKNVTIRFGSFWNAPLQDADGIYVFLHTRFMGRLDNKIKSECRKQVTLVSYTFEVPAKKATRKSGPMYVYNYSPKRSS